MASEETKI